MSNQVYSRDFLRAYQNQCKEKIVDDFAEGLVFDVLQQARQGEHHFTFDMGAWRQNAERRNNTVSHGTLPTNEELLVGVKRVFPECSVTLHETWMESKTHGRECKMLLTISWV
jgi:hypothetical protein